MLKKRSNAADAEKAAEQAVALLNERDVFIKELASRIAERDQWLKQAEAQLEERNQWLESCKGQLDMQLQWRNEYEARIGIFTKNIEKIREARNCFADEKSVEVFDNLLLMWLQPQNSKIAEVAGRISENCEKHTDYSIPLDENETLSLMIDKNQYYPKDLFQLSEHEVFVDAGAYDGGTILQFIDEADGRFDKVYGFEPSRVNYKLCMDNLKAFKDDRRVEVLNYGLSDEEKKVYFSNEQDPGRGGEKEVFEDSEECWFKPLSALLTKEQCDEITYIKMDIEGAELEALKAIRDVICKNKPKLAVCVYHKPEDIFTIPLYLHALAPEYQLYLRHHSNWCWETVLYAL